MSSRPKNLKRQVYIKKSHKSTQSSDQCWQNYATIELINRLTYTMGKSVNYGEWNGGTEKPDNHGNFNLFKQ